MGYADFKENQYTAIVWQELLQFFGSEVGTAAMMANLYAESGCTPWRCQGWYGFSTDVVQGCALYYTQVNDGTISRNDFIDHGWNKNEQVDTSGKYDGYGLAQWTIHERKKDLYDDRSSGVGIEDLTWQLEYLEKELNGDYPLHDYTDVRDACMNATQEDQLDATTDYVLVHFENPDNPNYGQRRYYAHQIYDLYAGSITGYPVRIHIDGNGDAYASMSLHGGNRIYRANAGDDVFIHAIAGSGDTFLIWTVDSGGVNIDIDTEPDTFFTMHANPVDITAHFTGTTPTPPYPPSPPARIKGHSMPIWMYPQFLC